MRSLFALLLLGCASASAWTTSLGDVTGWNTRTLFLYVNPANCPIPAATLLPLVDQAISVWNNDPMAAIQVHRAPIESTATPAQFAAGTAQGVPVIFCDLAFASSNGVDKDYVPAATRVSAPNHVLSYGGISLNAEPGAGANISTLTAGQLLVVIAHETGHVLGLGHSSVVQSLMYYSIANKTAPQLSDDDRLGLSYLYPRNELAVGAFGCGAAHAPATHIPRTLWLWPWWLVGILIAGRIRLRPARPL